MQVWGIRIGLALAATAALAFIFAFAQKLDIVSNSLIILTGIALFIAILVLLRQNTLVSDVRALRRQSFDITVLESQLTKRMNKLLDERDVPGPVNLEDPDRLEVHRLQAKVKELQARLHEQSLQMQALSAQSSEAAPSRTQAPASPSHVAPAVAQNQNAAPADNNVPFVLYDAPEGDEIQNSASTPANSVEIKVARSQPVSRPPVAPVAAPVAQQPAPRNTALAKNSQTAALNSALATDGLSLHLQPIVSLPDKKPRSFEAFMRLQTGENEYLSRSKFKQVAKSGGLVPSIETKVIFSAVRMLHSLRSKKKQADIFCALSRRTLQDTQSFSKIVRLLAGNQTLRKLLRFEMAQGEFMALRQNERLRLRMITDYGFSLCLSEVADLNLDPVVLAELGVQYIKVDSVIMLHADIHDETFGIPPTKLVSRLQQLGIELIVCDVERASQIKSLVNIHVRYGQGKLFAPPRPVKAELLEATPSSAREPLRRAS